MIKCKKSISTLMVAIFTLLVLSSTSASAIATTTPATILLAAQTAVTSAQVILSTSAYDLAVNPKILLKSNTAVIKAVQAIYLLNKTTADYKVLNAKLKADVVRMENAKKNIVAVKATEVAAAATAEAAIKAVEVAPIVTATDKTAAKVLQATAVNALASVRNSVTAKIFSLRLKVVTDKLAVL